MFKNIITSVITTLIIITCFMVGFTNFLPDKEPITNTELTNVSYPQEGIVLSTDNASENGITTNAVVGLAVENKFSDSLTQKLGNSWSVGTGFIVDSTGYIVTNYHVINGKTENIYVTLYGGDTVKGRTIWANQDLDLAIVKIEVSGLPVVKIGDSKNLKIGEPVIAIGNPLGFEFQRTVTSGIVSGLNRSIVINGGYMEDLIQTDASINPGNSGGPLVNKAGEVIGINTVKVETAEGIGFAIPINQIKPIIEKVKSTGSFTEPYFGIFGYDKEMISSIDSSIRLRRGIYVYEVTKNSPAYIAGIKKDDIILSIDDIETNSLCELREIIFSKTPGEDVKVTLFSEGENKYVYVKLTEKMS